MSARGNTRSKAGVERPSSLRLKGELERLLPKAEPGRGLALQVWIFRHFRIPSEVVKPLRDDWQLRLTTASLVDLEWVWGGGGQVTILERSNARRIFWAGILPQAADNLIAALRALIPLLPHGSGRTTTGSPGRELGTTYPGGSFGRAAPQECNVSGPAGGPAGFPSGVHGR